MIKRNIPIYGATLYIDVCDDINEVTSKMKRFKDVDKTDGSALALSNHYGYFAVLFTKDDCTISTIAHEVFHVTLLMMEWANCEFDYGHQEQGALLNGYIFDIVYKALSSKNLIKGVK